MAAVPVPMPTPREIKEYVGNLRAWMKRRKWESIARDMRNARKDDNLYLFLKWLYPSEMLLEVNSRLYPVAIIPAPERQWEEPESVLVKGSWSQPHELNPQVVAAGKALSELRSESLAKSWNSITYTMQSLDFSDFIRVRCGIGSYYDWLETCGVLEMELLTKFAQECPRPRDFETFWKGLKLRRLVHTSSLWRPRGISSTIGTTTLIVFKSEDGYATILRERSKSVASLPEIVGVIPSSTFEATVGNYDKEFSLRHNFYREYLEEIFSEKEAIEPTTEMSYKYFYSNPNLTFLRKLEKTGKARFLLSGAAMDLIRLTPEICSILFIDTVDWIEAHGPGNYSKGISNLKANWEYKTARELRAEGKQSSFLMELGTDFDFPASQELSPSRLSAPSAASIFMGLKAAKQLHSLSR